MAARSPRHEHSIAPSMPSTCWIPSARSSITPRRLITGDPEAPVLSVARPGRLITATPLMDREDVARLISKYDLLAVPVVDHGRVIGIVTVDDVIDAIVQESTEDVQKL